MKGARVPGWWAPAASVAALALFALSPTRVDAWYSRGLYPRLQPVVTWISNLTPFSWLDPLIIGGVALIVWRTPRLIAVGRREGLSRAVWEGVRRAIRGAGVLLAMFLIAWGLNYRRVPLDRAIGTPAASSGTTDELRAVLTGAGALAARLRPYASTHEVSFDAAAAQLKAPMNAALALVGRPPLRVFGRPKFTLFTPYFTWAGIDGMSNPFGLESIVQPGVLPFERPFVLAHEWGHQAGQADEAEASAVGWLACMQGGETLAYSADIYLIVELAGALPGGVWREMSAQLDPGVRADLRAMSERFQRTQPVVRRAASHVYDSYLRANGVSDGVRSYSRALSLILLPEFRVWLGRYRVSPTHPT